MRRNVVKWMMGLFIAVGVAGCGGGSGTPAATAVDVPTANGTPVNLQVVKSLREGTATGSAYKANLSGTDGSGVSFSGRISMSADGPVMFEGQSVTKSTVVSLLTNLSTGASVTSTTSHYTFVSDSTLYKTVSTGGKVYTPTIIGAPMPLVANVGDTGSLGRTTYGVGTTERSKWHINADVNGNAKLLVSYYVQNSAGYTLSTEINTYYINPSGNVYRYSMELLQQGGGSLIKLTGDVVPGV